MGIRIVKGLADEEGAGSDAVERVRGEGQTDKRRARRASSTSTTLPEDGQETTASSFERLAGSSTADEGLTRRKMRCLRGSVAL